MPARNILVVTVLLALFGSVCAAQSCHWEPCGLLATYAKTYTFKKSKDGRVLGLEEIAYKKWSTKYFEIRRSKQRDVEELEGTSDLFYFLCHHHFDLDIAIERLDAQAHNFSSLLSGIEYSTGNIKEKALRADLEAKPNEQSVRDAIAEILNNRASSAETARTSALNALKQANLAKKGKTASAAEWPTLHKRWIKAQEEWDKASQALQNARDYQSRADQVAICHQEGCVRPGPVQLQRYLGGEEHLALHYCPAHLETAQASDTQRSVLLFGLIAGVAVVGSILCGLIAKISGG